MEVVVAIKMDLAGRALLNSLTAKGSHNHPHFTVAMK
jgi:hypothetical protein